MNQLESESTLVNDRLSELAAWLRQGMRGSNRERQVGETFLDKLNAAIDAAGEGGLSGQQRTNLYELLLAANACDVAALKRLLVTADHEERQVLAGYRRLTPNGRAGVQRAIGGMAATVPAAAPAPAPAPATRNVKIFRQRVNQVADQIIMFNPRRDPGR